MRVINLDETGIKIISSNKKQIYLTLEEIKEFIKKKYVLKNGVLTIGTKQLILTPDDESQFQNIYKYIKTNFE